ncbi:MAG: Na+/H+ antiporter NhaA, partial [Acidimicrobiia bacterium]|nr:Na+/H+ antiporter NhaA [Acidimicrobiia bacterium]
AFAVGVVTLLGKRVPIGARTFLLTLAVVDDIGGIVVIAVFYTASLKFLWLVVAMAALAAVYAAQRIHVRSYGVYVPLAVVAWLAMHESGVHATIAGVLLGLLTPAWSFNSPEHFAGHARRLVGEVEATLEDDVLTHEERAENQSSLYNLMRLTVESASPLERHEYLIAPWVTFLIVPVFALANAGVRIVGGGFGNPLTDPLVLGPALGLLLGKPIGVFLFAYLAVLVGLGRLPKGVNWTMVGGLATTAGVGFTVALFITNLSFSDVELIDRAKVGVLGGSVVAGVLGYFVLRLGSASAAPEQPPVEPHAESVLA